MPYKSLQREPKSKKSLAAARFYFVKPYIFLPAAGFPLLLPLSKAPQAIFCNVYSIYCDFAFENTLLEAAAGENFDAYELA